jgi:hypothetical protein
MDKLHEQLAEAADKFSTFVCEFATVELCRHKELCELGEQLDAALAAYDAAKADQEAAKANGGWTLAADELPPIDVPVWCEHEGNIWIGGRAVVEDGQWGWCNAYNTAWQKKDGSWDADLEYDDDYKVTRWQHLPQPLPPPPEQT